MRSMECARPVVHRNHLSRYTEVLTRNDARSRSCFKTGADFGLTRVKLWVHVLRRVARMEIHSDI